MRERLYNIQGSDDRKNAAFLNKSLGAQRDVEFGRDGETKDNSRPIADLFPEVTVLFADLVGERLFLKRII